MPLVVMKSPESGNEFVFSPLVDKAFVKSLHNAMPKTSCSRELRISCRNFIGVVVGTHPCNAVGVQELDHIVHITLRILAQPVECGPIEQRTGNAVVGVFLHEHMTGGCDLPLQFRNLAFDGSFFLLGV
jgi:hypothetical protein